MLPLFVSIMFMVNKVLCVMMKQDYHIIYEGEF